VSKAFNYIYFRINNDQLLLRLGSSIPSFALHFLPIKNDHGISEQPTQKTHYSKDTKMFFASKSTTRSIQNTWDIKQNFVPKIFVQNSGRTEECREAGIKRRRVFDLTPDIFWGNKRKTERSDRWRNERLNVVAQLLRLLYWAQDYQLQNKINWKWLLPNSRLPTVK